MPIFDFSFKVGASLKDVQEFHVDTRALKRLNPPFIFVQLHRVDPMAEGSISEFTLWMGPIPIRWRAVHSNIDPQGFTDTQENGPLKFWRHTHHFQSLDDKTTQIQEHIEYEYFAGWRGILSRILFGRWGLLALFTYRKLITRWVLRKEAA